MPSNPEGLKIARARIALEKKQRTGFLDLGWLGLEEWPEVLWELRHLTMLNLGSGWLEGEEWHAAASDIAPNILDLAMGRWHWLPELTMLSLRGRKNLRSHWQDLSVLDRVINLRVLDCAYSEVVTLEQVAAIRKLEVLYCSSTGIRDLAPLADLPALTILHCYNTKITDLEALRYAHALQYLDCAHTQITSLEPLARLRSLNWLSCAYTRVREIPMELVENPALQHFVAFSLRVKNIPVEVLSPDYYTNCLPSLRSYLADAGPGGLESFPEEPALPEIKVMVLGNGRVGKTQICNRLTTGTFEENASSTHGITVSVKEVPDVARLRLWDFGGQDIYHGTHAMFMRSRALFLVAWTPKSEEGVVQEKGGLSFRNQPLPYWLAYIRHLSSTRSPVIILQNQCDLRETRQRHLPVADAVLDSFAFCEPLPYSALNERGRPALDEILKEAVNWLVQEQGEVIEGIGRTRVKERLEAMKEEKALIHEDAQHGASNQGEFLRRCTFTLAAMKKDARIPAASGRRHRTLTQAEFQQICDECGGVSSTEHLLDYLHQTGIVFYQKGLFDDLIILDQAWVLEAVYAVFNRDRCYRQLLWMKGRFRPSLLGELVWEGYSPAEQALFLSVMQSCGICFVYREGDEKLGIETEYIAPDMLPDYTEVAADVKADWDEAAPWDEARVELPFLHPGIMRGLIARIGQQAGIRAVYWKDGLCLYEQTTGSRARIDQLRSDEDEDWSGDIIIRTQKGESLKLAEMLQKWACQAADTAGCTKWTLTMKPHPRDPAHPADNPAAGKALTNAVFAVPPRSQTYGVSYAWKGDSVPVVERLCAEALGRGIHILRDTTNVGLGEKLSGFMSSLAEQDRLFIILSDAYLRSENCMFELKEVWRYCQQNEDLFRKRVRLYRMPDANVFDMGYQLELTTHWLGVFDRHKLQVGALATSGALAPQTLQRYNNLHAFASHVSSILNYVADTLLPKDFEALVQHGFGVAPGDG